MKISSYEEAALRMAIAEREMKLVWALQHPHNVLQPQLQEMRDGIERLRAELQG